MTYQQQSMPQYRKPNTSQGERRRGVLSGERRKHPARLGNLRSDANHPHHRANRKTPLHLAPPLQALEPNVGDHLEGNVEERMYVYLLMTIQNTAIDQGAAICKQTMAPGKCIHVGQRP